MPEDVLDGFVNADGEALGRPVGVAVDVQVPCLLQTMLVMSSGA